MGLGGAERSLPTVLLVAAALIVGGIGSADAVVLPPTPKIEIRSPRPGLPDLPDPPQFASLDLRPPSGAGAAHPRLLFGTADLPAIRARIAVAPSKPATAWAQVRSWADNYVVKPLPAGQREGLLGREDLATLGFTWLVTGDSRYLVKAKALLKVVAGAAPDYTAPLVYDATEYYNKRAHLLNGFALAYDWLYNDLTADERQQLQTVVLVLGSEQFVHAMVSSWWSTISTGSNFTGNNGASVGMAGLALWGDVPGLPEVWTARGSQLVRSYLTEGFDATGAGFEGILYGNYGLRIPTLFSASLERVGAANPLLLPRVRRQQEWFAYEVLPGGGALNPLNDARYYELNEVHLTWATAHGRNPDLAGWIFNHKPGLATGDVGEPIPTILWFRDPDPAFAPAQVLPLAKVFPGRGLVHVRSGWDALDLMSSFEARQADWGETIHQNQDVNAFTLYAYGARLAIDSGYANYLEKILLGQDFEAARSSQTEAHNAVDIDGRTQDFHGKGALRRFVSTATVGSPGAVDVAVGDARLAWLTVQPRRADRYFIHVRGEDGRPGYLVIGDAVQGFGAKRLDHDYRWFLQTEPGNQLVTTGPSSALVTAPNGVRLDITMASAAPTTANVDTFTADFADIGAHPRLVIRSRAPRLDALTALVPTAPSGAVRPVTRVPGTGGVAIDAGGDIILLRTGTIARAAGIVTDGELVYLRPGGAWSLVEGTRLSTGGHLLAVLSGAAGSVIAEPGRIAVAGQGIRGFRIRADGAPGVTLNGSAVATGRCGADIVWPATRAC